MILVNLDDAEKITNESHGSHMLLTRTCTIQKLKTLRGVYQCDTGQIPSDGQIREISYSQL